MIYWFGSDMTSEESDGSLFDKEAYNSDSINQDGFQIDTIFLNSPGTIVPSGDIRCLNGYKVHWTKAGVGEAGI